MSQTTILIVEDESIIAADLLQTVAKLGYSPVGRAAAGVDAVAKALDLRPDVILMDIRLQGRMTGIEAAITIRQEHPSVSIVFLSAFTPDIPLDAGYAFVPKPFSLQQLRQGIETAVQHRPCHSTQS